MNVDTQEYENTHVKSPRGSGSWMFKITLADGRELIKMTKTMTYTKAKKEAIAWAKRAGAVKLEVMP